MEPDIELQNELGDIQGNILRPYAYDCGRFLFLEIPPGVNGNPFLKSTCDFIADAKDWDNGKPITSVNVALSATGLQRLGVPENVLTGFPEDFRQGMEARSNLTGDRNENSPNRWAIRKGLDVFISVYAQDQNTLSQSVSEIVASAKANGLHISGDVVGSRFGRDKRGEHFGYADGIGQPDIEGVPETRFNGDGIALQEGKWRSIKIGEFLLGYPNERQQIAGGGIAPSLGRNGTFVVIRKYQQDVSGFRTFLKEQARTMSGDTVEENEEWIAAKLVGRWRSGCPLMASPTTDNSELADDFSINNDFRFASDPIGKICPRGAHIRRMNPRDSFDSVQDIEVRLHRIIRRGMTYGPELQGLEDDGIERGILFIGLMASIKDQFEFVQKNWVQDGTFADQDSDRDPITGDQTDGGGRMKFPGGQKRFLFGIPNFVRLDGGGYFFMPGLIAMQKIVSGNF